MTLPASPHERTLYLCAAPPSPTALAILERLEAGEAPGAALLCVAPEPLRAAAEALPARSPRFACAAERTARGICAFVRETWGPRAFRAVRVIPPDDPAYPLRPLAEAITGDLALDWSNAAALIQGGRRLMRNFFRNLPLLGRASDAAALSWDAAPVLVAGAGPSLDAALEALGAALPSPDALAGRPFRILAVDTALPCLAARGLRPDLTVALESRHANLQDFVSAREALGTPLAMDLSAHPATAGALGGPLFLFFTPWTPLSLFTRMAERGLLPLRLPPLGSVGLSAVALALRLTSGPVLCAGLDFAFPPGCPHARGAAEHLAALASCTRLAPLPRAPQGTPCASGRPALRTTPLLSRYRGLFARDFAPAGRAGRLFRMGAGGLSLGIPTLSLDAACALLRRGPPPQPPPAPPMPPPPAAGSAALEAFLREERRHLERLSAALEAPPPADEAPLRALLAPCGCLWSHFPECAAREGRLPETLSPSFLNRVQWELRRVGGRGALGE